MGRFFGVALCCAVLLSTALAIAPSRTFADTELCRTIVSNRNKSFDKNKSYLQEIAQLRREISGLESRIEILSGGAEAAARAELGDKEKTLKIAQAKQSEEAKRLKDLDAQVERCRASRAETNVSEWAGVWQGPYRVYHISVMTKIHIDYTLRAPDTSLSGYGQCVVRENTADCKFSESYRASDFEIKSRGRQMLTLSGNTIKEEKTLEEVSCDPDGPWCSPARKAVGKTQTDTWHRK